MRNKYSGFTLIEVMVTVAIVGILAAIAIPSYSQYIQKTRRTDAQEKLLDMAAQQERWFFSNNQYAKQAAIDSVGGGASKDNFYTVTITTNDAATTYSLTAKSNDDKSQSKDTDCWKFTLTNTGAKSAIKKDTGDNSKTCWQTQ
jgi:type IV pilus assembly protein PilE